MNTAPYIRIESRLKKMDREVQELLHELQKMRVKDITLDNLISTIAAEVHEDVDTTKLIRSLREREYF